jgi:hypothetical protein
MSVGGRCFTSIQSAFGGPSKALLGRVSAQGSENYAVEIAYCVSANSISSTKDRQHKSTDWDDRHIDLYKS